jgi:hypothetical protein
MRNLLFRRGKFFATGKERFSKTADNYNVDKYKKRSAENFL